MDLYLIKSAACLAILLVFYKVFLEKESFHTFKRFYLLAALAVSLLIPFITFTEYVEPEYILGTFQNPILENIYIPETNTGTEVIKETLDWTPILWTIYGLGVLFFSIRFLLNLSRIVKRIHSNPKTKRQSFINVLLNDLVIPHTFFNYIFLNKSKFEKQEIPEEVLLHEQTHAKQKHSLDILFIEILQVVFWFNPLIYLIKKDIKLNHEFLADQAVVNHGTNPITYQQLLLAFSSNAAEPQLANAINYSSIKKRFTVMKTRTTQKTTWVKSLVLLPLLAIMVYGFSTTKTVEKEVEPIMDIDSATKHTARNIDIKILEDGNYSVDGIIMATKNTFVAAVNTLHQDITPEIRNNIINIHVGSAKEVSNKETWFIYNALLDYGFYRIVTPNQEVVRGKGNTPFKTTSIEAKESKEISTQQSATREQMAEYNKLAKHYNSALKNDKGINIKMKDVKRLKYIYGIMSEKQRKDAEPFPDFPEPPPPPKMPDAPEVSKENMIPPPPPPIPSNATPAQKAKYQKVIDDYEKNELIPPPPPPPVPDPVKHMKEMNKKGATFYYEGKKISGKEAIKIAKDNKDINIQIRDHDSSKPTVKLSTKPIKLNRKN